MAGVSSRRIPTIPAAGGSITRVHEERFEHEDGPLRAAVTKTVTAYLDCGILRAGFARVRGPECKAEFLVAFSCECRGLRQRPPASDRPKAVAREGTERGVYY